MSLLREQEFISPQTGQPVNVVSDSAKRVTESNETVALYYYASGTRTADAGQAAGVAVMGQLAFSPVLDSGGTKIATNNDKSLSFTCDALTSEKPFPWNVFEEYKNASGTNLLSQITSGYANGEYCVDYIRGTIYGIKATTTSSMTSVGYKRLSSASTIEVGSIAVGDVEIGAVELKNADDDTRAKIGAGSSMATTDNALSVADANVKSDTAAIKIAAELIDDAVYINGTGVVSKGILMMGWDGNIARALKTNNEGNLLSDVEIGAVELKDSDSENRAEIHAPNVAAVGYALNTAPARYLGTPVTITDTYSSPLLLGSKAQLLTNIYDGTSTLTLLTGTTKTIPASLHDGTTLITFGVGTTKTVPTEIHDGTTGADVIATINSLKSDISSYGGTAVSAANALHVQAGTGAVFQVGDNASSLSIDIGGQAPQLDDTDKLAVSLYGKGTVAGDTAVDVDGDGHMQIDVLTMPSVTVDSEFPAAAAITDNFVTPTTTSVMAMGMWYDGATWDMARGDATNGLLVNLGANNDVTVTGSLTTVSTVTAVTSITNPVAVTGTFWQATQPVSGTFWQTTQPVSIAATVVTSDAATTSIDGKITACNTGAVVISSGSVTVSATDLDVRNLTSTDVVTAYGSQGVALQQKITSNDLIITLDGESVAVTGTFWQATQPVSGTFWQTTQPVSIAATVVTSDAATTSIDGKITACNTGAVVVSSGTITAVTSITNAVAVTGTFWQATQPVSIAASVAVTDAISGGWDNAASDGASVSGDVAHDTADAGEPVKLGAKAVSSLDDATMVAANDRTNLYADIDGVLITKNGCPNADIIMERVSNTDGASTALTNFGATVSTYNIITDIIVHNAHASTNGYVDIRDGAAGTVIATIPCPANGGATHSFRTPLRSTANTAIAFDPSAAITTLYLTFVGYKSKA